MSSLFKLMMAIILHAISFSVNGQLKLHISGMVQQESTLYLAIFDNQHDFLSQSIFYSKKIATTDAVAIIEINDLPLGTYAISVFQDLNDNEKLDKRMFGIPTEPYGFSGNGVKFSRAPTFSEASFQYSGKTELKIALIKR